MRFLFLLALTACASAPHKTQPESIRIELRGQAGASTETRYHSHANVKTYSESQILRDKQEVVDFTTITKIRSFDPATKLLSYTVRTTEKDGTVSLHDLAFPEKNEEIDFIAKTNGIVIKAGSYSPQSLFFVPAMPVPGEEVRVGDTWTMEHTWFSAADNIPLKLDIVGILKAIVPCAGTICADIEVSGSVKLVRSATTANARFDSRVWGRILYSPSRGDIVWSEMRSQEEMNVGADQMSVLSCMVSETKISGRYRTNLNCAPEAVAVKSVPVLN